MERLKILVVDDDDFDRENFRRVLGKTSIIADVFEAKTGKEALDLLGRTTFDCIVVDHRLGGTTGTDLVRLVKQKISAVVPIIMVTGMNDEELVVGAMREGVYDYLSKSRLDGRRLQRAIEGGLRWATLERQLAEAKIARKRVEKDLGDSRQQLIDAQRIARLGSWYMDLATGEVTWSDEVFRLFGYEPGSVAPGKEAGLRRLHPDDRARVVGLSDRFVGNGEPHDSEYRIVLDDGTVRYLVTHGRVFTNDEGTPIAIGAVIQDVTDQKVAELALRESEEQLRGFFEFSAIGMLLTSRDGLFVRVNRAFCALTGYAENELVGMRFVDLTHPDDRRRDEAAMKRLLAGDLPVYRVEKRYIHKNGEPIWVAVNVSAVRGHDGAIRAFATQVSDIRARKKAELALTESERRFRALAMQAPIGIFETAPSGACTFVNARWLELTGSSMDRALGDGWAQVLHPDDRERVLADWNAAIADSREFSLEYRFVHASGRVVWVSGNAVAIRNDSGDVQRYLGTVSDITARKAAERHLIAAKDAAESATRAKSDFLARMSHEIRTPMNSVIGMTRLALDTVLTAEQRDYLEMVDTSARSLLHIISDILDFSKIEAGRLTLESTEFRLRECVGRGLRGFSVRANEKGVGFSTVIPDSVPDHLIGDPYRLQQILVNLVSNALKFTEAGNVVVAVQAASATDEKVKLEFSVTDTGIGIAPDRQKTIFEAFSQAEEDITRKYGGTGLGLTICSELVAMMNGRIWLESEPGKGSCFRFSMEFGLAPEATRASSPGSVALPQQASNGVDHPRLKVLVAEDNTMNQRLVSAMLARIGHTAIIAPSGEAALRRLAEEPFDVVLMDVQMPGMSGIETVKILRAKESETGAHVPVIAVTAQAMRGDRERCIEAGMDDYLPKPLSLGSLTEAIARATKTSEPSENGEPAGAAPFDRQSVLRRMGNDDQLFAEIVALFRRDAKPLVAALAGELERHDAAASKRTAHQIKGMLLNLSATRGVAMAKEIERLGADGIWDQARRQNTELAAEIRRIEAALGEPS